MGLTTKTIEAFKNASVQVIPGEAHIGATGGNSGYVELTLTLDTAAYATGEVLFDTQELTDILRNISGTGVIQSVILTDEDDQGVACDLVFLRTNVSLGTENAAISLTDVNSREVLGIIQVVASDYVDLGGSRVVTKVNVGIGVSGDGLNDLFVGGVSRGAGTYTATGMSLKVFILQD